LSATPTPMMVSTPKRLIRWPVKNPGATDASGAAR
jgi:hypothetical protein